MVYSSEGLTTITHDPDVTDGVIQGLTNTGTLGDQAEDVGIQFAVLPQGPNPPEQHITTHTETSGILTAQSEAAGGIGYDILSNEAKITFLTGGGLSQEDPDDLYGGASRLRYDFDITFAAIGTLTNVQAEVKFNFLGGIECSGLAEALWEFNYSDPQSGNPYIVGVDYQDIDGVVVQTPGVVPGALSGTFSRSAQGAFDENVVVNELFALTGGVFRPGRRSGSMDSLPGRPVTSAVRYRSSLARPRPAMGRVLLSEARRCLPSPTITKIRPPSSVAIRHCRCR